MLSVAWAVQVLLRRERFAEVWQSGPRQWAGMWL